MFGSVVIPDPDPDREADLDGIWGPPYDEPMTEAEAAAASGLEAWGGRLPEPGYGYADWVAEGRQPEAGG
jgi:hypothetical protein